MSRRLQDEISADFDPAEEMGLAHRFGLTEEEFRHGRTYELAAEKAGLTYEMTLPAGTELHVYDRTLVLQEAVRVRSNKPWMILAGQLTAEQAQAWPPHVRVAMVEPKPLVARKVARAYLDVATIPEGS